MRKYYEQSTSNNTQKSLTTLSNKETMELSFRAWVSSKTETSSFNLSDEELKFVGFEKIK